MKIKVKMIGVAFPQELQGTVQEVEVIHISLPNGVCWGVGDSCEIELVDEISDDTKNQGKTFDFGDNQLKTLTIEFK